MSTTMRNLADVQASLAGMADTHLKRVVESAPAMSTETSDALNEVAEQLEASKLDLEGAVDELAAVGADKPRTNRKARVKTANAKLKAANLSRAKAKEKLAAISAKTKEPGALGAIAAANGMIADTGKALDSAHAATKAAGRTTGWVSRRVLHGFLVFAVAVVAIFAWERLTHPGQNAYWSVFFAWAIVVGTLWVVIYRDPEQGVYSLIVGEDKRFSTSKTQAVIWTVAVGFGISYLVGRVALQELTIQDALNPERLDEYLLLLGGPFAAGVVAKFTTAAKVDSGALQKTEATEPRGAQLLQNDSGHADLVDTQYFLFNLIVLGYYLVALARTAALPEIPTVLLGLTSASAFTYSANKAAERNAPLITAVSPRTVLPGDELHVHGQNFLAGVENAEPARAAVLIDGLAGELRPGPESTEGHLVVMLPSSAPAGTRALTVRTAANVVSGSFLVEILDNLPVALGLREPARAGTEAVLVGRNFLSPGMSTEEVTVTIDDLSEVGTASSNEVAFTMPKSLGKNIDVDLTVTRSGATSAPIKIHLK